MAKDDENRPAKGQGTQLVKAPKKQLAEKPLAERINTEIGQHLLSNFAKSGKLSGKVSINNETKITYDMTPEHANAVKEMKRYEHAVPAEQQTRRSIQLTMRHLVVVA